MIRKSVKLRLKSAGVKTKAGITPISIRDAEADVRKLVEYVYSQVHDALRIQSAWKYKSMLDIQKQIREAESGYKKLKPSEEARQAGINFKSCPSEIRAKSRVETLIRDQLVSKIKKWDGGFLSKPNAGKSVNLAASNNQQIYREIRLDGIWLFFKAWDRELVLQFNLPKGKYRGIKEVALPNVSIDALGKLSWSFVFQEAGQRPEISGNYVLGVDRGVNELAAWSVYNLSSGETVDNGFLSSQSKHIYGKINRIEAEIRGIRQKIDVTNLERYKTLYTQLKGKKEKVERLKIELCKLSAQEIVALSAYYDNCMIILEDLSWAGNWHGKVPFGLLRHWVEHYAEQSGTRVQYVNAAFTSQECSFCGVIDKKSLKQNRDYVCNACQNTLNRDINAARNVAKRGAERSKKSSATRQKYIKTPKRQRVLRRKRVLITVSEKADRDEFHSVLPGLEGQCPLPLSGQTTHTLNRFYYRL